MMWSNHFPARPPDFSGAASTAAIRTHTIKIFATMIAQTGNTPPQKLVLPHPSIMDRLIVGDLSADCTELSHTVRVFLSSTFTGISRHARTHSLTDTEEERNTIIERAVPILQSRAQSLGFEFCLSEMRWGITKYAADHHDTAALCLQEVAKCRRESAAIHFVVCFFLHSLHEIVCPYRIILFCHRHVILPCRRFWGKNTAFGQFRRN